MFLTAGSLVADKYKIEESLGAGGMGVVYRARQDSMSREVALKFLTTDCDEDSLARFKREAKIMSDLQHRNLVRSHELGVWDGCAYLAMEYVEGISLERELRKGPMEPKRAIAIFQQIAEALQCAHANGVIHRDLKPSNVLLCAEDLVKVIDFGLAKLISHDGNTIQKLTDVGMAVGTVLYMSPEQCMGKRVDARSDIYALGAIMYHCLSGEPPFPSDQVIEAMSRQVSEMPVPIKIQKLPEGLESIMMRCLAKDAEQRYQTAAELNVALNMVASGSGSKLTVFLPSGTSSPVPLGTTMASNKPGRLILSVAVATLLLAGVAWFADQLNQSAQPVPERHYASLADMYRSGRPMSEVVAHCQNADELIDILSSLKSPTRAEKYMLADLYLQVTNVDAAAQAIESAPKEAKPSKHDPLKANIALLQGDLNTALKLCSEPVEAADGMSGVRTKLCLARVLLAQNKPDKALEVLRSIEDNTHDADPAADRKALTILANYQKTHNLPAWESGLATEPDMAPMDAMTRYDVRAVQNAYFFVPFHMRPRPPYIGNMQTY